jgi:hypothetical protein
MQINTSTPKPVEPVTVTLAPSANPQAGVIGWVFLWWLGVPFFALLIIWALFFR